MNGTISAAPASQAHCELSFHRLFACGAVDVCRNPFRLFESSREPVKHVLNLLSASEVAWKGACETVMRLIVCTELIVIEYSWERL